MGQLYVGHKADGKLVEETFNFCSFSLGSSVAKPMHPSYVDTVGCSILMFGVEIYSKVDFLVIVWSGFADRFCEV